MKAVMQHPERDMENKVKVIDQELPLTQMSNLQTRPVAASVSDKKQSSLPGLDLATRSMNKSTATHNKTKRRLQFNDSVEVYYYPENREQHDHHHHDDYDEDEDEEEMLRCEEPKLSSSSEDDQDSMQQDMTDPPFELLLFDYITHQLLPRLREQQSSSIEMIIGKRAHRSRANSLNSPSVKSIDQMSDSDSKSLSTNTNEHSFPTTGVSAAELDTTMTSSHQKTTLVRSKGRCYEVSSAEIQDVVQQLQPHSASPVVHKYQSKR